MLKRNLCKKCKIKKYCCYQSVLAAGESGKMYSIILKNQPCKFLDTKTSLCLSYKNRFKLNPYCLTVKEGIKQNAFHKDCLYIKAKKHYRGNPLPRIDYVPDDVLEHIKLRIKEVEEMNPSEFRRKFLPLIL